MYLKILMVYRYWNLKKFKGQMQQKMFPIVEIFTSKYVTNTI